MELHELHERVRQFERNRKKGRRNMERMRPKYDNDGSILYYEAEYPKSTTAPGAKSPYFLGEVHEDSAPVETPEIPLKPVTRPEW